ncbi:uncharacterized protein PHACADRAFT_248781 [Phanerochaete carnosa HHB-10118-sp]|uniref:Uncharacterized protein n=1 Tax=Phanerochaete carnosa (strain HHB-10118-sp) TaxID=650164 RepID=K5WRL4_PHACS|nr:uncharacterized protein PHACADRAFT_248781 [Phanerochaete carnosa HHB-10118-sp]EKM61879.1 hypothetical protein PHACADRAFT_248781 [Phanerochaete carnosa HHB-10118-sp]
MSRTATRTLGFRTYATYHYLAGILLCLYKTHSLFPPHDFRPAVTPALVALNRVTSAKLTRADTPTLYLATMYDFDDTPGLLVVGNRFGKLALLNFSTVLLPTLAGCLLRSEFVSEDGGMGLFNVAVTCSLTPPFPCSAPRYHRWMR